MTKNMIRAILDGRNWRESGGAPGKTRGEMIIIFDWKRLPTFILDLRLIPAKRLFYWHSSKGRVPSAETAFPFRSG